MLFNGTPITIRPIRPEDSDIAQEFVRHLSEDSRHSYFMGTLRELPPRKLEYLTHIDYEQHMGFVATILQDTKEVGVGLAHYVATKKPGTCEFGIAVDDARQGTGVAGLLMIALQDAACRNGFESMEGIVFRSNRKMLKFARQMGFRTYREPGEEDTVHIALRL